MRFLNRNKISQRNGKMCAIKVDKSIEKNEKWCPMEKRRTTETKLEILCDESIVNIKNKWKRTSDQNGRLRT